MDWTADFIASRADPLIFVEKILGVDTLEPWQREALEGVRDNGRIAVKSGHGVGKTAFISWCVLWWLCTRKPCKILVTANSEAQLRDVTWSEIHMWARQLPQGLFDRYEWGLERIQLKGAPSDCFASRRTASIDRPESLQGFHSEHTLVIVEEASGVPDPLYIPMLGALSTEGSKFLLVGNPTRGNGYFYDAFNDLAESFFRMTINSEDVPRAQGHIQDIINKWGKGGNDYRVRVLGLFPSTDDETVIPRALCEAAQTRDVEPTETFRVVWGLDVARFGSDCSALAKRMGNVLLDPPMVWRNKSTMEVTGAVVAEFERVKKQEPYFEPSEILVDSIGVGAGVVDRLAEKGLPVRGINVGELPAQKDIYVRLRDELWFRAREWLEKLDCRMPDDDLLVSQLTSPTYTYLSNGKLLVETKAAMKKRTGGKSPDLADAFCLTFAGGLETRQEERYANKLIRKATSWMAA